MSAVIEYTPRVQRGGKGEGCGCGDTSAPAGQPIVQRVGPLQVTTEAPCKIIARVGGFAFAVSCDAQVRNVSDRPVALLAQQQNDNGISASFNVDRGHGVRGMIASLPTSLVSSSLTIDMLGPMRLDPGQAVTIPSPPPGSVWTVIDVDPQAIQRAAWVAGGTAVVVGAGIVYGGVKAVEAIARRRRRR